MGVDEVVVARAAWPASARSTPRVNAHSWPGSSSLASPSNGPAVTCRTRDAGRDLDDRRQVARTVARVKISTSTPRCGQAPGELDDVDVHAAGVAGARLVERRGVHG